MMRQVFLIILKNCFLNNLKIQTWWNTWEEKAFQRSREENIKIITEETSKIIIIIIKVVLFQLAIKNNNSFHIWMICQYKKQCHQELAKNANAFWL